MKVRWSDGLLLAFAILAVATAIVGADPLDLRLTVDIQRLTGLDAWFRAASGLGGQPVNIVAPIVAIFALIAVGWWRDAAFMVVSVIGSTLLQHGLKLAIGRTRPLSPVRLEAITTGSSFPSGHVMEYFALFGFAAVIVCARVRPSLERTLLLVPLIGLVFVIGPSRVYLGAHWPTDVLGAYLIGGWWLSVCARAYHGTLRRA